MQYNGRQQLSNHEKKRAPKNDKIRKSEVNQCFFYEKPFINHFFKSSLHLTAIYEPRTRTMSVFKTLILIALAIKLISCATIVDDRLKTIGIDKASIFEAIITEFSQLYQQFDFVDISQELEVELNSDAVDYEQLKIKTNLIGGKFLDTKQLAINSIAKLDNWIYNLEQQLTQVWRGPLDTIKQKVQLVKSSAARFSSMANKIDDDINYLKSLIADNSNSFLIFKQLRKLMRLYNDSKVRYLDFANPIVRELFDVLDLLKLSLGEDVQLRPHHVDWPIRDIDDDLDQDAINSDINRNRTLATPPKKIHEKEIPWLWFGIGSTAFAILIAIVILIACLRSRRPSVVVVN